MLRALWTQPVVTFDGRWHRIDRAGINPLPVQRPIPVWMGGWDERVLRRVGRLADGWFPLRHPPEGWRAAIERVQDYARAAGRDPSRSASSRALASAAHRMTGAAPPTTGARLARPTYRSTPWSPGW